MRRKSLLILSIVLLVVGFASVATNLIINNTLNIGYNNTFLDDVVFIKAKTEGTASISEDGKTITYDAKKISAINEEATLTFWVKNKNTQYDADVTINCSLDNNSSTLVDLVDITIEPSHFTLESNEVKTGEVKVRLKSVVTEEKSGTFTCELVATPSEREVPGVIIPSNLYEDEVVNGAKPELSKELIPITLDNTGVVTYANTDEKWYDYANKEWANAVILVDNPRKQYNVGDVIIEDDIESYFVWIPRYRYKLFHANQADGTTTKLSESIAQEIEIEFESKDTPVSTGTQDGEWLTHPAFTNFDVNGIWVGKFETGYKGSTSVTSAQVSSSDPTKIQVKPNVNSWRSNSVGNFFKAMYNYNRELDSHMTKNTEWGAVAYLSHSRYGINDEARMNNNQNFLTGYAANTKDASESTTNNQRYNTEIGYLASTTGNITGIYDMSGGAWEYVAGYRDGTIGSSGLTLEEIRNTYSKYIDVYASNSSVTTYSKRILGDATGEMGPFYGDYYNNWYNDYSPFVDSSYPWFLRGGGYSDGSGAGQFYFVSRTGGDNSGYSARLVLLG